LTTDIAAAGVGNLEVMGKARGFWASPPEADDVFVFKTVIFNASAAV